MSQVRRVVPVSAPSPTEVVFEAVGMENGKLPGYEIAGNRVLLGVYIRPDKTKGGIILTDTTRDEEKNIGKACVVLALGPTAFESDEKYDFKGFRAEVGDWVAVHVYEARPVIVNGHPCRIARDSDIVMKIPAPDSVR